MYDIHFGILHMIYIPAGPSQLEVGRYRLGKCNRYASLNLLMQARARDSRGMTRMRPESIFVCNVCHSLLFLISLSVLCSYCVQLNCTVYIQCTTYNTTKHELFASQAIPDLHPGKYSWLFDLEGREFSINRAGLPGGELYWSGFCVWCKCYNNCQWLDCCSWKYWCEWAEYVQVLNLIRLLYSSFPF